MVNYSPILEAAAADIAQASVGGDVEAAFDAKAFADIVLMLVTIFQNCKGATPQSFKQKAIAAQKPFWWLFPANYATRNAIKAAQGEKLSRVRGRDRRKEIVEGTLIMAADAPIDRIVSVQREALKMQP